jgi:hypothetical protein
MENQRKKRSAASFSSCTQRGAKPGAGAKLRRKDRFTLAEQSSANAAQCLAVSISNFRPQISQRPQRR